MEEKIEDDDFLGISLSPLTSQGFPVLISSKWEDRPTLNEIFVTFELGKNRILGKLSKPETRNPFLDKEKGQELFDYIKRFGPYGGLEGPDSKIAWCEVIGRRVEGGKIVPLQSAPSSQVRLKPANETDLDYFFQGKPNSLKIARVRMSDFRVPIPPKKLFSHLDVVAPTGWGKTFLGTLLAISICGREMRVVNRRGQEETRKIKTWVLDITGQIAEDDYGVFRRLRDDPRKVVRLLDIQIERTEELVAAIEKAFNFHRMPFRHNRDQVSYYLKEIHLKDKSNWNYQAFRNSIRQAVERAYRTRDTGIKAANDTIDILSLNGERIWKEKIEPRLKAPYTVDDLNLETEGGKMIVVNLRDADEIERPVFANVLLDKLFLRAREVYDHTRAEYGFATLIFIDEVQDYCPQERPKWFQEDCHRKIIEIAKQGRKYGLGLVLMTQRYADVDKSALTQMNSHFIGGVTYSDRERVKNLSGVMPEEIDSLGHTEFWFNGLACPVKKMIVQGVGPEDVPSI